MYSRSIFYVLKEYFFTPQMSAWVFIPFYIYSILKVHFSDTTKKLVGKYLFFLTSLFIFFYFLLFYFSFNSNAALIKPLNNGCALVGLDLNSGWNWQPTNQGWSGASTISTNRSSGEVPEMTRPASVNSFRYLLLNSQRWRWRS